MEANRTDAEDCIRTAKRAAAENNYEKAVRFLEKSLKLYPTDLAKNLLEAYQSKLQNENEEEEEEETETTTSNTTNGFKSSNSDSNLNDHSHHNTRGSKQHSHHHATASEPPPASFSSEQADAVRKIKNCKDFYEILGVPKSANEAELKKAYCKLALQFHPDKNKAPGATEAFKMIGKAFSILNDTSKRKQYDQLGPDSFNDGETSSAPTTRSRHRGGGYHQQGYSNTQFYWNDDDFSADELFNLFFGVNPSHHRGAANRHHPTFATYADQRQHAASNSHAVLFQLMPILLIIVLTLLSNFLSAEPAYSLHKTDRYNVKRVTTDHHVPYFVKSDFKIATNNELNRLERQVEEDLLIELRQNCFREKSYKEAAIWRARNYGDERLLKKAYEYETPSCNRMKEVFGIG